MASVFKSKAIPPGMHPSQSEVFNWEDVASRAKQYLDTVREQAQQLLRDSQQEIEQLKTSAQAEGIRGSEAHIERLSAQKANQIADQQIQLASRSVAALCEDLEAATQQWLRQWQHETITLAIAITEKLVSRQVETDPSILLDWIEDSVRMVQGQRQILVRIHPEDAQRLSSALAEMVEEMKPSSEIQVSEDVSVGRCGVILQTPTTVIDRTMQTQLKRLVDELA
jgi:flagellar biosynthesis/type III secretory pathway protein FliH